MLSKSFTLLEVLVVVIILAILASIAVPTYRKAVQKAEDKEAIAMLKLIAAAEKMYHLEYNTYISCSNTSDCNNILNLDIPSGKWGYTVSSPVPPSSSFTATATGAGTGNWCINQNLDEPQQGGGC